LQHAKDPLGDGNCPFRSFGCIPAHGCSPLPVGFGREGALSTTESSPNSNASSTRSIGDIAKVSSNSRRRAASALLLGLWP
jgi:hypothetical protein